MLEPSEKLSEVAVTVRFTVVVADAAPLVPFTVIAMLLAAAVFAAVEMTSVLEVELTGGAKLHVAPDGNPALQENETVPLKPFFGVIVMVVLLLLVPADAVTEAGLGESVKAPAFPEAAHAVARLFTSTDPRPVAKLKLFVGSEVEASNPNTPAEGQSNAAGCGLPGVPTVQ